MSTRSRHLVTGATGLVGGALVLELLQKTDDLVLALVRPGVEGAEHRLRVAIQEAAAAYGHDDRALPLDRLRAIAGDVTQPLCGTSGSIVRFDVLWHSAASLRFEDRYEAEILATNVEGTRNVLALARSAGARVVNHISTAYVAGRAQGVIREVPAGATPTHNHYERSKILGEALARDTDGVSLRILRPGIVVGHSETLAATTFSGMYGFTRQLVQFRGVMDRMQRGMLQTRPLRMRVNPDLGADLVPVDEVAAQAVHIGLQADACGAYHLTQAAPPSIGDTIRDITRALGFADPEFVGDDEPLEWLDEQLDSRLSFYGSYVKGDRRFDRSRADAALGGRADLCRTLPPVTDMVRWYVDRLEAERRALPAGR